MRGGERQAGANERSAERLHHAHIGVAQHTGDRRGHAATLAPLEVDETSVQAPLQKIEPDAVIQSAALRERCEVALGERRPREGRHADVGGAVGDEGKPRRGVPHDAGRARAAEHAVHDAASGIAVDDIAAHWIVEVAELGVAHPVLTQPEGRDQPAGEQEALRRRHR